MLSKAIQDAYLGSEEMRATASSMALAALILGLDIVELWSEDSGQKLHCTYVHASDDIVAKYPSIIVGHYPMHKREHIVSPKLCVSAKESPNRCHWKIIDPSQPKPGPQQITEPVDAPAPLKTEICYWVESDSDDVNIFIVGFSVKPLKLKQSKLKFLNGIGYAIYVAAFDLDEEDAGTEEDEGDNALDNKEFVPRPITTPFASVVNLKAADGAPTNVSSLSLASSPALMLGVTPSSLDMAGNIVNNESPKAIDFYGNLHKSTDSNPSFLFIDAPSPRQSLQEILPVVSHDSGDIGMNLNRVPSDATIQFDSEPVEGTIVDKTTISTGPAISTFYPPTWEPGDEFSFPVADMPVRNWVPDNLTMEHFTDISHIADGSNAHVFLAKLDRIPVIVKMIKEASQYDSVAVHEFEVEHGLLIRLNHPHIIRLLGAGRMPRRFIVLEYLGGGTLTNILTQNQQVGIASKIFRRPSFTYASLIAKLRDMADAFEYLHFKCHERAMIIHRDLKPDNVGFTLDGVLKLFDFGLCTCVRKKTFDSESYEMTGNTGSLRYMAPEVASRRPYNEKADVYSFGIMAWQMARDRVPFKGMNREDFMKIVVVGGERPALDKTWPQGFSNLLTLCWHNDPNMRPSFGQVKYELNQLIEDAAGKSWKKNKAMTPKEQVPSRKPSPPLNTWFS